MGDRPSFYMDDTVQRMMKGDSREMLVSMHLSGIHGASTWNAQGLALYGIVDHDPDN